MSRRPLCPPCVPFARTRNLPSGRLTSSHTTSSVGRLHLVEVHHLPHARPDRFMNVSGLTSNTFSLPSMKLGDLG